MSNEHINDNPMLKIVLCEEEEPAGNFREKSDGSIKSSVKDDKSITSRVASVRKLNGVRSANFLLAANPYQRRGMNCGNCQTQNAKNNVSPFTQKIMSAKLIHLKQMQNQISEMSLKINELTSENKILKTLQRRQDNALKKYEGSKEQLPQLMKSHSEELRVINMKYKQLKTAHREMENKLKQRDIELMNLKEQHTHLLQLSRDKHLCERDKLTKKVASLELYSKEQNEKIVTLQRKLELQEKNFKHQLQIETQKHRETQSQLHSTRQMNNTLRIDVEGKVKSVISAKKDLRFDGQGNRSRASFPSPVRSAITENHRGTKSETGTKSTCNSTRDHNDAEYDPPVEHEGSSHIKVSIKRSELNKKSYAKQPTLAPMVDERVPPSREGSHKTGSAASQETNSSIPGGDSVSSNPIDEAVLKTDIQDDNRLQSTTVSPRFSQAGSSPGFRSGISIPSDLIIGNGRPLRTPVIKDELTSDESDDEDSNFFNGEHRHVNLDSSGDDSGHEIREEQIDLKCNASRARAEQDIDKIISKACDEMLVNDKEHEIILKGINNFSLSKELSQLRDLSWDELQKQIGPMKEEMINKMDKSFPKNDYRLDANEKNDLLKALNMIDGQNNANNLNDDSFSLSIEPERAKHQSVRQMFAQNRKKVDLMKTLFGGEGDAIPVIDGIN